MEGAQKNFLAEFISWNLLDYKAAAQKVWEQELNKIKVQGSKEDKTIFYSSLYHSLIAPNTYNDVDGSYRGLDQKIHKDSLHNTYTVFSLWDTFRAAHPLYTLIDKKNAKINRKNFKIVFYEIISIYNDTAFRILGYGRLVQRGKSKYRCNHRF